MDAKDTTDERLVIDEARYKNLKAMLNSTPEDVQVALSCIKTLNKQRNYVAIAFLRQNTRCDFSNWAKYCKTHLKYQESLGIPVGYVIKISDIYKALDNETAYKDENKKFFTARYAEFLESTLAKMDFVESIEIKVKLKDYE
jgi:outer membrane protease